MSAKNGLHDAAAVAMLAADDLERSSAFWEKVVGLEEVYRDEGEVVFSAGPTVFGIYEHDGGSSADHTQMLFEVPDVRASKRQLEERGVTFEDYDMPGLKTVEGIADMGPGGEAAWFTDPGGNIIGLITESRRVLEAVGAGAAGSSR